MIRLRGYDEIRQTIRNNINDLNEEVDSKAGTFVSDVLVCPQADVLAGFYADLKIMELNQCVTTASGYDLDRLGFNYFTYRRGAVKADGKIRFYIKNTNRTVLDKDKLPASITIPAGYKVSTTSTATDGEVVFITTESAQTDRQTIYSGLSTDTATGYKYLEVDIIAQDAGESGNCNAGTICEMYGGDIDGIVSCYNPIATTGGQDQEPDASLKYRIMQSVLGASICTKKGYEKLMLMQDYVQDVMVVGAGDELMFRDGGYINSAKEYIYGQGGMVDIWLRGKQLQETSQKFTISSSYLRKGASDVILNIQPTVNVVSIVSNSTGQILDNASDYDIEYGTTAKAVTTTYYKDIVWDFSITDTFTDTDYYPMYVTDLTEIEILRQKVNSELTDALDYLTNVNSNINWALVTYEDISKYTVKPLFQKVYYNGLAYKLIALDARLNGRTFVKKQNRIYLRCYETPDYALVPTTYSDEKYTSQLSEDVGGSIISKDCIHWLKTTNLQEGDSLTITYNYNQMIQDVQAEMNAKRILTADILIRQATEVPVEVAMDIYVDETVETYTIRNTIASQFSIFINYYKTMGDILEESELVAIARKIEGVTMVDLDSVYLSKKNSLSASKLELEPNEYFSVSNISLNVISEDTITS